jgi:hypothetical protein
MTVKVVKKFQKLAPPFGNTKGGAGDGKKLAKMPRNRKTRFK